VACQRDPGTAVRTWCKRHRPRCQDPLRSRSPSPRSRMVLHPGDGRQAYPATRPAHAAGTARGSCRAAPRTRPWIIGRLQGRVYSRLRPPLADRAHTGDVRTLKRGSEVPDDTFVNRYMCPESFRLPMTGESNLGRRKGFYYNVKAVRPLVAAFREVRLHEVRLRDAGLAETGSVKVRLYSIRTIEHGLGEIGTM